MRMHICAHFATFSCQSQGSGHPIAFTCHRMTSIDAVLTVSSIADMSQVRLPAERDVVLATGRAQLTMIKNTNTRTPFASILYVGALRAVQSACLILSTLLGS